MYSGDEDLEDLADEAGQDGADEAGEGSDADSDSCSSAELECSGCGRNSKQACPIAKRMRKPPNPMPRITWGKVSTRKIKKRCRVVKKKVKSGSWCAPCINVYNLRVRNQRKYKKMKEFSRDLVEEDGFKKKFKKAVNEWIHWRAGGNKRVKKLNTKVTKATKIIRDLIAPKKELWPLNMYKAEFGAAKAAKAKITTMKTKKGKLVKGVVVTVGKKGVYGIEERSRTEVGMEEEVGDGKMMLDSDQGDDAFAAAQDDDAVDLDGAQHLADLQAEAAAAKAAPAATGGKKAAAADDKTSNEDGSSSDDDNDDSDSNSGSDDDKSGSADDKSEAGEKSTIPPKSDKARGKTPAPQTGKQIKREHLSDDEEDDEDGAEGAEFAPPLAATRKRISRKAPPAEPPLAPRGGQRKPRGSAASSSSKPAATSSASTGVLDATLASAKASLASVQLILNNFSQGVYDVTMGRQLQRLVKDWREKGLACKAIITSLSKSPVEEHKGLRDQLAAACRTLEAITDFAKTYNATGKQLLPTMISAYAAVEASQPSPKQLGKLAKTKSLEVALESAGGSVGPDALALVHVGENVREGGKYGVSLVGDALMRDALRQAMLVQLFKSIFGRGFDKKDPDNMREIRQQVVNDLNQFTTYAPQLPDDIQKVVDKVARVVTLPESASMDDLQQVPVSIAYGENDGT